MAWTFDKIFKGARHHGASDVHLIRGVAPVLRINGEIRPIEGEPLSEETLRRLLDEIITDKHRETLEREWQLCFSRFWPEIGRFRVSVYYHAGSPEMAIRLCESVVRTAEELGLPSIIEELTRLPNGLVLVTGPTGVGKTTTLNFMIDSINRQRRAKIVAITVQLANSLQAIVAQKLLPRADGKGRILACEVCIATLAVRNRIREREVHLLYNEMQTGRKFQMQTMDNALLDLYQRGEITYDAALSNAREPDYVRHKTGGKPN